MICHKTSITTPSETEIRIERTFEAPRGLDSMEDRDGMLQSGMERGVVDSYSRLDELFERQQAG